jgi:hypothetical protein
MSRLPAFCTALFLAVQPAAAEVCDKVLGDGFERLMNAPLWYQVGDRLLSPVTLVLIALAVLTATKMPRLRGIVLVATLLTAIQAVRAIAANVFPDDVLAAARIEGCGGQSLAAAMVSSALALLLGVSFVIALDRPSGPRA